MGLVENAKRHRFTTSYKRGIATEAEQSTTQDKSTTIKRPVPRRADWLRSVDEPLTAKEQKRLQWSTQRGLPFVDETWAESIAGQTELESTHHPRGRAKTVKESKDST